MTPWNKGSLYIGIAAESQKKNKHLDEAYLLTVCTTNFMTCNNVLLTS